MDAALPVPTHVLTLQTTPAVLRDTLRALLQTIFFHRYFTAIRPLSRDVLGLTLPAIDDPSLDALISERATQLLRRLERSGNAGNGNSSNTHAIVRVEFFEKKRRKTYTFFGPKDDEKVCWERWRLDLSVLPPPRAAEHERAMERVEASLLNAAKSVVDIAAREKEHIPVITQTDGNPFPYEILIAE